MVIKYQQDSQASSKVFIGRIVHSKSLKKHEILPHAALGVKPTGSIAFLTENIDDLETLKSGHNFTNPQTTHLTPSQFLFPGLIDTHLHAPQWPNLALGMEGTLREWVENYTDPMEASYSSNKKARRVYSDVVNTTLKLGSTTVAYNTTIHADATNILAKICVEKGQRTIVGKMCVTKGGTSGNCEESTEKALRDSEKCLRFVRELDPEGKLVRPCVQPRGGPFCPPELMEGLGRQRERFGAYVQGHMCETQDDINRTLALHPTSTCYTEMYASHSLLTPSSIMAHSIHLTPTDLSNLTTSRAGVAHNPNSNTCLRDGICRVRDLLNHNVKVGLGTDCSAGYMPSIHSAIRSASNVSRQLAMQTGEEKYVLGFSELVWLATMGGAEVVGMEREVGNFEVGKKFDALVVDCEGVISVDEEVWKAGRDEDLVKKWVFLGDDRTIRKVFVDGRLVAGHDVEERR